MFAKFGQTKIQNLHAIVIGDEDVLRFQIAMDDASFVGSRKTTDDLLRILRDFSRRCGSVTELNRRAALYSSLVQFIPAN